MYSSLEKKTREKCREYAPMLWFLPGVIILSNEVVEASRL